MWVRTVSGEWIFIKVKQTNQGIWLKNKDSQKS